MIDYSTVLSTAVGAAIGGLITAVATVIVQRHESKIKEKKDCRDQVVKAYDDLSYALSRYNRD